MVHIDIDAWNHILVYLCDDQVAELYQIPDLRDIVERQFRARFAMKLSSKDIRQYTNYRPRCKQNAVHECDHRNQEKSCTFRHGHKNRNWDIVVITLNLCHVCYSYGLWSFYERNKRVPKLRCEGSAVRSTVIDFLEDIDEQFQWFVDPKRISLRRQALITNYDCHYQETTTDGIVTDIMKRASGDA
jgi:hypothetical protein